MTQILPLLQDQGLFVVHLPRKRRDFVLFANREQLQ